MKYTTSLGNGIFESSSPIYFADATENTVFSAYYPYQENVDDDGTIYNWSMAMVEEGVPCPADFLFASGATASKSSPQVKFTGDNNFKHCMSMIQLIIKAGNGINAEYANLKGDLYNPQNQKSRFQKRKIKKNGKRFVDSLYSLIDLKTI